METMGDRVRRARRETDGMTQIELAKAAGVSQTTISDIERGRNDESVAITRIATALKVRPEWLTTGTGPMRGLINTDPLTLTVRAVGTATGDILGPIITIPHLSAIGSMGDGVDLAAEDTVIDRLVIKRDWLMETLPGVSYSKLAIISGKGDSMCPTFCDGDLLLVDTSRKTVDVDGVYVLSAHERLFIKSVRQRIDGSYEISSDNPKVKTVDILNGDHEVTIHGRVVWAWNGKKL